MVNSTPLAEYRNAAATNDPRTKGWGLLCLAGSYHYGWNDTPIDLPTAASYYEALIASDAHDSTKARGAGRYAMLLSRDANMLRNHFGKFLNLCDLATESDEIHIKLHVLKRAAMKLIDDDSFPNDPERATVYFETIIRDAEDDPTRGDAAYKLAYCLQLGKAGFARDPRKASELHNQVLTYDDPESEPFSACCLATMAMGDNESAHRDFKRARALYELALKSPFISDGMKSTALFNLGIILSSGGYGTTPDRPRAYKICDQLDEIGHPRACELRYCLDRETGKTVEFIGEKAFESFLSNL